MVDKYLNWKCVSRFHSLPATIFTKNRHRGRWWCLKINLTDLWKTSLESWSLVSNPRKQRNDTLLLRAIHRWIFPICTKQPLYPLIGHHSVSNRAPSSWMSRKRNEKRTQKQKNKLLVSKICEPFKFVGIKEIIIRPKKTVEGISRIGNNK